MSGDCKTSRVASGVTPSGGPGIGSGVPGKPGRLFGIIARTIRLARQMETEFARGRLDARRIRELTADMERMESSGREEAGR